MNNHSFMENPINYQYDPEEYRFLLKLQLDEILGAMDLPNLVVDAKNIHNPISEQIIFNINENEDADGDIYYDEDDEDDTDNDEVFIQTQTESLNTYKPDYHPAPLEAMSQMSQYPEKLEVACSLCLEQNEQNEGNVKTPCGHIFHKTCIQDWLICGDFCPICRFSFNPSKCS